MKHRAIGIFLLVLVFAGAGCSSKKAALFEEKRDFSSGQATFDFPFAEDSMRHKIFLTVDMSYASSGSYRIGATLSTPSNQFKETEVKKSAGEADRRGSAGGLPQSHTTLSQTDEFLLYEIVAEKGPYRLAIYKADASDHVKLPSISIRVE